MYGLTIRTLRFALAAVTVAGCSSDSTQSLTEAIGQSGPPAQFANGTFETGTTSSWTASGTISVQASAPHGGTYAARIGNPNPQKGTSSLTQKVTLPAGTPTLSFWYKASDCNGGVGRKQAYLVDANGRQLTTILDVCGPANAWTLKSVDLTQWAGQVVTLQLIARNDGVVGSTLWIDDVTISACGGQPVTTVYLIDTAQLINLAPCGGNTNNPYNNCMSNWGFAWTDTDSGQPTSVTIEIQEGNQCNGNGSDTTTINNVSTGTAYHYSNNNCSCSISFPNGTQGVGGPQTISLSGAGLAAYHTGQQNTFMVNLAAPHCEGPARTVNLANSFARVTVTTPGASNLLDCDGNPNNGCEVNKLTNDSNCGACGMACMNGQTCVGGVCTSQCGMGQTLCGTFCFNLSTDPSHCGACNTVCSNQHMGPPTCAAGTCDGTCLPGYADLNGNKQVDGCEATICGDGLVRGSEECDDHNNAPGDGCSALCLIESGFVCNGEPSVCVAN